MFRLFGLLLVGLLLAAFHVKIANANTVNSGVQLNGLTNEGVCRAATSGSDNTKSWSSDLPNINYLIEAKIRNINCGVNTRTTSFRLSLPSNETICRIGTNKTDAGNLVWSLGVWQEFAEEAKRRGLSCGVDEATSAAKVLSNTSQQKQYKFALMLAMDNDLAKAEQAFKEISENPLHPRKTDALFWLGRTQFMQKKYKDAYDSLTKFNAENPRDGRIGTTSLWIAETVPYFMSRKQVCEVYNSLLRFKIGIRDSQRIKGLVAKAGCDSKLAEIQTHAEADWLHDQKDSFVLGVSCVDGEWLKAERSRAYVDEAKRRGLSCGVNVIYIDGHSHSVNALCNLATKPLANGKLVWDNNQSFRNIVATLKKHGVSCGVDETLTKQAASSTTTQSNTPTSAELLAAQRKAEELEQQLAALKAEQEQQQQTISNDTKLPIITIASASTTGAQGVISGRVNDNTGVAELRVDGQKIAVDSNGNFSATTYVPEGGTSVNIEAIDLAGLSSTMSVRVDRATTQTASISFDRLNPLKRKAAINNDALALVIGVSEYKETNAKAIYADSDAKVFQDYAIEKLGVPRSRVKTLVNDGADEKDMLLATKRWLSRAAKQGKTDVYIFFAGHGLASDDGSKMYLLPYDGAPELLDKTAILRDELFADISAANPRSVTVFLDTCYSGTTRGTDMLIASRPIAIRALEQSIPDNFTVMTAAAGDQTAKPLEEAKHGMFSYFLMKGMEGEADANNDNEITAGELHSYVQTNVIQQSSGSQTPELQGDADRVLVRFQ